jgi:short-subunit dehydrogenase
MKKTIFITGASSGLGKASSLLFQKNGWNVIATMRSPEKETELNLLENVTLLPLDVTNSEQVRQMVEKALSIHPIDVVLNNAGYGLIGPLEALTAEQINSQIQTNLFGVIYITKALVPYLRKRRSGVIINVTSSFGLLSFPTCSVYSATKFAIDGFSEGLYYELAQFGIQVKVVAPGGMQTNFTGRSMQGGTHDAYQQLIAKVSEGYSDAEVANYTKAEDVAQIIFDAATDDKDQLRYVAGEDAIALYQERLKLGPEEQVRKIKSQFVF